MKVKSNLLHVAITFLAFSHTNKMCLDGHSPCRRNVIRYQILLNNAVYVTCVIQGTNSPVAVHFQ